MSELSAVNGILLVNKPIGMTSNTLLQKVKRLYGASKAGHTGSLDPLATGMLPVCFGEATKFSQYLLDADKCYEVTGHLGIKTNTSDAMGEVIARKEFSHVTVSDLKRVLPQFQGNIKQIPSMFSALKHQGMPLYKYARAGETIDRQAREIMIYQLQLINFNQPHFDLVVNCSKGTYIRNLIEDIGDQLDVGAHVTQLHRKYTAGFAEEPMYTLEALKNASAECLLSYLLPVDRAVAHLPAVTISTADTQALLQGKIIQRISLVEPDLNKIVRLYENGTKFIGLGECLADDQLKVKRLLSQNYL